MQKLFNAVDARMKEVNETPEQREEEMKPFSIRLPLELLDKLEDLSAALRLNRTDVARMILTNGVDDIFEHLELEVPTRSKEDIASFADIYALQTGQATLPELMQKWAEEKEGDKQ